MRHSLTKSFLKLTLLALKKQAKKILLFVIPIFDVFRVHSQTTWNVDPFQIPFMS